MLSTSESLKEKFIKKGFWIYFFVILTAPLGYIVKIVLAGELSPSEIGILYTSISLLTLIGTYTDLGLTESLGYFLPRYIIRKSYAKAKLLLATTLSVQIISSIIVGLLLYFGAEFLATHYLKDIRAREVFQVLSLFFLGIHLLQINVGFFGAIQATKYQRGIDFFRMGMTLIGVLILFFSSEGTLFLYTCAWVIGVYLALILSSFINYKKYYRDYFLGVSIIKDTPLLKEFFRYSFGTLIAANISTLLHQVDQQLIAYFVGTTEAGIYTIYLSLISIPFIFFTPIISFLFPVVSELHEQKSEEKLRTIYTLFNSYFSSFMIWVGAFFFLFGREISIFLFSETYALSGEATRYMSFFLVWNILIQISFQFLAGLGYIRKRIVITGITLVINIILLLFMIWISKITDILPSTSSGASLAVGLSWIVMWYLSYRVLHSYQTHFDWKLFFRNTLGIIIWGFISLVVIMKSPFFTVMSSRLGSFKVLLFAFCLGVLIFLIVNKRTLSQFIEIIRSTKNIIKSLFLLCLHFSSQQQDLSSGLSLSLLSTIVLSIVASTILSQLLDLGATSLVWFFSMESIEPGYGYQGKNHYLSLF